MNNIVNKGHGPLNNDNHSFKKIWRNLFFAGWIRITNVSG
jgi:hypothetical protein